ncbi:MAG: RHS repeat-associated core domain-containing protein, partial [Arenimonas sp.]
GSTTLNATYLGGAAWRINTGGVTRYRLAPDFEWNETAGIGRTHVVLGGQVIAITEDYFTPQSYGGCGQVWPRNIPHPPGGDLALMLAYALSGALASPLMRSIRRHRPRGARAWIALGTGAAFVLFVSIPPNLVPERAEATSPPNTKYFHADRLGSSLVVSDNSGSTSAKRVVYRPYGDLVQNSASTATVPERGFTGQRFEPSVGVYVYNARWYDPGIAKFVQPDAVASVYDPQALGPYAYVRNDPVNRIDPSGNESIDCLAGACFYETEPGAGNPGVGFIFGFYRSRGLGFAGCINFMPGSCGADPGWFIFSSQQIERAVARVRRLEDAASAVLSGSGGVDASSIVINLTAEQRYREEPSLREAIERGSSLIFTTMRKSGQAADVAFAIDEEWDFWPGPKYSVNRTNGNINTDKIFRKSGDFATSSVDQAGIEVWLIQGKYGSVTVPTNHTIYIRYYTTKVGSSRIVGKELSAYSLPSAVRRSHVRGSPLTARRST